MRQLTSANVLQINKLVLATIASYTKTCREIADTVSSAQMYADDVVYNATALQNFNKTLDVLKLHTALIAQDTVVREEFYTTLKYIEINNLIDRRYFACM